jgi:uncharacterized protein (TIGR03437 family)
MPFRRPCITARLAVPWLCLCMVLKGATGNLSAFDEFMNGLLAKWRIPGAALGVSRHGRLILAHAYGMTGIDAGQPVQPDSLFRIGGISKSIAAAAILRLVEDGKASPDQRIFATLRSGLEGPGPGNCGSSPAGTDDAYAPLRAIVEKASGQSYESFVKSAVLLPLGISRMRMERGDGWMASVFDLLRFVDALDGRRPPMLLTQKSLRAMIARPATVSAAAPCYTGLGWVIQPVGNDADWWNFGDSPGGSAYVFRQAATGVDVALLFNSGPADSRAFEAEVSAVVAGTADSITQWPAVDQFAGGPELFARDVVNAADYSGGGVAPGEFVVLYPSNAGPPDMVPWGLEGHLGAPTPVGETRVFFDNREAPVVYSVSGKVAVVVPNEIAGKKTTEVVVEYQGRRSHPVWLAVLASTPALYTLDESGKGQAAMLNETGCCNSVRNPAVRGTVASLYATGQGRLAPGRIARNIAVTVGGVPAEVLYTGYGPSMQVNFRVPANAPAGDAVPLVLTVGNRRSSPDVTMAVRSARQRVLVVDGDTASGNRLARILGGAGYQVSTVANAPPDLAILDLGMPQEESLEKVRALRKAYPQLKIMAMSRVFGPEALRAADLLGAQAVLTKPLNAATVLKRVSTLLQRRPAVY